MNKISKRITLSMHFGIFIFIINLITTFITGVLMYLLFSIGILNEKNIINSFNCLVVYNI